MGRTVSPLRRVSCFISAGVKPESSTFTSYVAGRRPGTEKRPSPSVTTTRCAPVATCVTVTVAPGSEAWVVSVTRPMMADEADSCACAPTQTTIKHESEAYEPAHAYLLSLPNVDPPATSQWRVTFRGAGSHRQNLSACTRLFDMTKRETLAVPSTNLHKNRPSYQRIPITLTGIDDVQRASRIARLRTPEVVKRGLSDRQRGLDSRGRTYTFRYQHLATAFELQREDSLPRAVCRDCRQR